jgi:hypothetical protein
MEGFFQIRKTQILVKLTKLVNSSPGGFTFEDNKVEVIIEL